MPMNPPKTVRSVLSLSSCVVAFEMPKSMIFGCGSLALGGDEDIGRLQIAMDDALLVSVLHALADLNEQLEPLHNRQFVAVGVGVERLTSDVLHREVGPALIGRTRVEDPGNRRMIDEGERLTLGPESRHDRRRVESGLDYLDCHATAHWFDLLCEPHLTHTTFAEHLEKAVCADAMTRADHRREGRLRAFVSAGSIRGLHRVCRDGECDAAYCAPPIQSTFACAPRGADSARSSGHRPPSFRARPSVRTERAEFVGLLSGARYRRNGTPTWRRPRLP